MTERRLAGALALLLVTAAGALAAAAESAAPRGVLALVPTADRETVLVRLEPRMLRPAGTRVRLDRHTGAWSFSPDRRTLVLGQTSKPTLGNPASLRFVDVVRMRPLGDVVLPAELGRVVETAWLSRTRVVALLERCCPTTTRLFLVDAAKRRVLQQRALDRGQVVGGGRIGGGLVLLVAPDGRIGSVRVVVVRSGLRVESVELTKTTGGTAYVGEREERRVLDRRPGFALDVRGGRAFVIAPGEPAAEVELRSLRVAYHALARRTIAARAKSVEGASLRAEWLGGNRIAVSGAEYRGNRSEPLGLQLVDTRSWSSRTLDERSFGFVFASATLVTAPARHSVVGYALDGTQRFERGGALVDRLVVVGREAHVPLADARRTVVVVDVRSGRELRRYRGPAEERWPYLLPPGGDPIG